MHSLKYSPIRLLIVIAVVTAVIFGMFVRQHTQGRGLIMQENQTATPDWEPWLAQWSRDILKYLDLKRYYGPIEKEAVASGWLGYPGATEDQIMYLEARLGKPLPPSYRAFLKVSNGFRQPGLFVPRLLPVDEVEWFRVRNRETIDMWKSNGLEDLTDALAISPFDTDVYLLNPKVVTADGEWEALDFNPGGAACDHYSSFWELMQAEQKIFLRVKEWQASPMQPDDDLQMIAVKFPGLIKVIERNMDLFAASQKHYREQLKHLQESRNRSQQAPVPAEPQGQEEQKNSNQSTRLAVIQYHPAPPQPVNPQPVIIDGRLIVPVPDPTSYASRLEQQVDYANAVIEGMVSAKSRVAEIAAKSEQPEVIFQQLRSLARELSAKYLEQMQNRTGGHRQVSTPLPNLLPNLIQPGTGGHPQDRETGLNEGHWRVAGTIRFFLNEPSIVSWDDLKTRATASARIDYSPPQSASAIVVVIVNVDGIVTRAYYVDGDEGLGRAAAQALTRWRFQPYELHGHTVDQSCEILVRLVDGKIELLSNKSER
jgi:hypothetical protein